MPHESFFEQFKDSLKMVLNLDELNAFAVTALKFFIAVLATLQIRSPDAAHPMMNDTFHFLLDTTSPKNHVRIHITQFIAMLMGGLGTDINIADDVHESLEQYLITQLKDTVATVRLQAVYAISRLQNPLDEDNEVVKLLLFHMSSDPSVLVRKATIVVTAHARHTMPHLLERLQDIDEGVRRTAYLQLSAYHVRRLTIADRLMVAESGCNDRSELVRRAVHAILLPQWLDGYGGQYVALINAMKLDATYEEIQRFAKVAKQAMMALFK